MDRRFVWAAAVVIVLASIAIALSLPYRPCAGAFTDTCRPPKEASGYTRFEPDWPVRWAVIGDGVVLAVAAARRDEQVLRTEREMVNPIRSLAAARV